MILICFIELIIAIIATTLFFAGAWVPSTTFMGFMFVAWIISTAASLLREVDR